MTQESPVQPVALFETEPLYHTTCHDCLMEALHRSLRAAASEERAHRRAHPDHTLSTERVDR